MQEIILPFFCFLFIAFLYSSVGHAGASGYLATMALLSFQVETIKPISLVLNVVVASIASYHFIRAGYFDKKIFIPHILSSLPMAYLGGTLTLEPRYFKISAGIFLLVSAVFILFRYYQKNGPYEIKPMKLIWGITLGAIIGFFSGIIGVGGGIFLSPIMILGKWTSVKNASGVAALFILLNSLSGLAGNRNSLNLVGENILYWVLAVIIGGLIGSHLGSKKFQPRMIIHFLFIVLLSAGIKFTFFS